VKGNQVSGKHLLWTTGNKTSFDDDFFHDVNDLFANLNMGYNTDNAAAAAKAIPAHTTS
jgi:hypothetical protein